ncbi:hypothetical protein Ahy_Scaffold6g108223 [Arachis hypogaea]|uniref:SWIM-type domain-containing protein n=1 Tax=Arachis hypogaea TaxID=3818 RepID=A0A444WPX7_ARAHY|nr:hypothetical protein Ahy_Scaffold6g108223 [Arachis hypogaea]
MQQPQIELYVEFENIQVDGIQNDSDIEDDRATVYEGMNSDSKEDFKVTYEAGDEEEDGDVGVEAAVENVVVHPSGSHPMNVPPFMRNLNLDAMHTPEFMEYAKIGVADPEDGEFRIGMEYNSRKSVVAAIISYTISRGVDYNVYEFEPQTFYTKCKKYGRRCDWLIRASLIQRKGCWEIRKYNSRHTRTMLCTGLIDEMRCLRSEMTSEKVLVVDLTQRTCDCGHFQVERLSCRHVIACCANQCLDWQLYVHDVYKMTDVHKVYRFEFTSLGDLETWLAYEGPTLVANPALRRTLKGRPKLIQYLNEMDSRDMRGARICRLCGA